MSASQVLAGMLTRLVQAEKGGGCYIDGGRDASTDYGTSNGDDSVSESSSRGQAGVKRDRPNGLAKRASNKTEGNQAEQIASECVRSCCENVPVSSSCQDFYREDHGPGPLKDDHSRHFNGCLPFNGLTSSSSSSSPEPRPYPQHVVDGILNPADSRHTPAEVRARAERVASLSRSTPLHSRTTGGTLGASMHNKPIAIVEC